MQDRLTKRDEAHKGAYYLSDMRSPAGAIVSECVRGKAVDRLAAYEDTGLTPEQVAALQGVAADLSHEIGRKNVECAKLEDENADKERYTTELYSRARDAEREREELRVLRAEAKAVARMLLNNVDGEILTLVCAEETVFHEAMYRLRRIAEDTQEG